MTRLLPLAVALCLALCAQASPLVLSLPRTAEARPLVEMGNATAKDGSVLLADSLSFKINDSRWCVCVCVCVCVYVCVCVCVYICVCVSSSVCVCVC